MFVLNSDITIGNFHFNGVNEVRIKRSTHSYVDTATIKLPSIAVVYPKTNRSNPISVTTATEFKDGDPVTIKLGYNNDMQEEFCGFVKHCSLDMPLEITCEGYSYLLRRNKVSGWWKSISIEHLLVLATNGLGIKLNITADILLQNVKFSGATGADVIEFIKKATDGTIAIFFIQPDTLYAGLIYTQYAQGGTTLIGTQVSYKLGVNALKDNELKIKNAADNPVKVSYSKKLATGEKVNGASDQLEASLVKDHKAVLNNIASSAIMKQLAQEKQYQTNYVGYEGSINTFLQPYCLPGYTAYIEDKRYPDKKGIYAVESIEVSFGMSGARRKVEIGPIIGFANKKS